MRFQVGDIVRIGMKTEGRLDYFDEFWRDDQINGTVLCVESGEYPVEVQFDEESDGHSGNYFDEITLRLVRR